MHQTDRLYKYTNALKAYSTFGNVFGYSMQLAYHF